jgi:hypothetical protein
LIQNTASWDIHGRKAVDTVNHQRRSITIVTNQTSANIAAMDTSLKAFTIFLQAKRFPASTAILVSNWSNITFSGSSFVFRFKCIGIAFKDCLHSCNSARTRHTLIFTLNATAELTANCTTSKTLTISDVETALDEID